MDEQASRSLSAAARVMARHSAAKGGRARMAKLTVEQKSKLGRKAIRARWRKKRKNNS